MLLCPTKLDYLNFLPSPYCCSDVHFMLVIHSWINLWWTSSGQYQYVFENKFKYFPWTLVSFSLSTHMQINLHPSYGFSKILQNFPNSVYNNIVRQSGPKIIPIPSISSNLRTTHEVYTYVVYSWDKRQKSIEVVYRS